MKGRRKMINEEIIDAMVRMAKESMKHAYTSVTKMAIGSCVLTSDGTLYGGCNIENASPALSCCAEAVAMYKAISDSKREFDALAVIADTVEPFVPCGACCQLMAEFGVQDVFMANVKGDIRAATLADLMPLSKDMMANKKVKKARKKKIVIDTEF